MVLSLHADGRARQGSNGSSGGIYAWLEDVEEQGALSRTAEASPDSDVLNIALQSQCRSATFGYRLLFPALQTSVRPHAIRAQ